MAIFSGKILVSNLFHSPKLMTDLSWPLSQLTGKDFLLKESILGTCVKMLLCDECMWGGRVRECMYSLFQSCDHRKWIRELLQVAFPPAPYSDWSTYESHILLSRGTRSQLCSSLCTALVRLAFYPYILCCSGHSGWEGNGILPV